MEGVTGMSAVVTALTTNLTTASLFENVATLVPFLAGMVIFAFSYRILRRSLGGASRGQARC